MAVLTKVHHDLFPDESASADDNDFHGCPPAARFGANGPVCRSGDWSDIDSEERSPLSASSCHFRPSFLFCSKSEKMLAAITRLAVRLTEVSGCPRMGRVHHRSRAKRDRRRA